MWFVYFVCMCICVFVVSMFGVFWCYWFFSVIGVYSSYLCLLVFICVYWCLLAFIRGMVFIDVYLRLLVLLV